MTFGDVLAAIALFITVAATLCCSTVLVAIVAAAKVDRVAAKFAAAPAKVGVNGLAVLLLSLFDLACFHTSTVSLAKFGFGLLLLMPSICMLCGSSVMVTFVAARQLQAPEGKPALPLLFRSALVCLGSCLAPGVGWFVVAPISLLLILGAGADLLLTGTKNAEVKTIASPLGAAQ